MAGKVVQTLRLPLFEGLLPARASTVPGEIIAGLSLAALAIPEVPGYTTIAGTPPITGLYTMRFPWSCSRSSDPPGTWSSARIQPPPRSLPTIWSGSRRPDQTNARRSRAYWP